MKYRHKKRGTTYEKIGEALLQSSRPVSEDQTLVIYRGASGQLWARPKEEFEDGRFEEA